MQGRELLEKRMMDWREIAGGTWADGWRNIVDIIYNPDFLNIS
jgi:hypothetical protein